MCNRYWDTEIYFLGNFFWLIQRTNNLPELLPAFTCSRAIGNLQSICLRGNILSPVPFVDFDGNILLLKAWRANSAS